MSTIVLSPTSTSSTAATTPSLYPLSPPLSHIKSSTPSLKSPRDKIDALNRKRQEQWALEIRSLARAKTRKVAVLLLSWAPVEGKSLKVAQEIEDLTRVFETKYRFKVYNKMISSQHKQAPRYQLQSIFHDFLVEHDRAGTLCIVYYGGHGMPSKDEEELILKSDHDEKVDPTMEEVQWSMVEPLLHRLSADLLLILDCCYAGIVARSQRTWPDTKAHFEFLGSTTYDRGACGPESRGSFTRALIHSLAILAETEKVFTTSKLVRTIEAYADFRYAGKQQPCLSECGKKNTFRRLKIMPLEPGQMELQTPIEPPAPGPLNFYLHLKYVFTEEPTSENISALVERLCEMIKNDRLPVSTVIWEGLSPYNPRMHMADAAERLLAAFSHRGSTSFAKRFRKMSESDSPPQPLQRTLTSLSTDNGTFLARTVTPPMVESPLSETPTTNMPIIENSTTRMQSFRWNMFCVLALFLSIAYLFAAGPDLTVTIPLRVATARAVLLQRVNDYVKSAT